jgi:hypothetical protein
VAELDGLGPALARIVAEGASAPGRICRACLAVLPVTRAAVTVMTSADRQEPVRASDDVASHLDEMQFSLGEGRCVEAFTAGRPVLMTDLAELSGHRWPMFADAAAADGPGAVRAAAAGRRDRSSACSTFIGTNQACWHPTS